MLKEKINSDDFFNTKLPGVTTVLSDVFGKDDISNIPEAVLKAAAERGSAVHKHIEDFINTKESKPVELAYQIYTDYFYEWYNEYKPEFITSELKLVSNKLGFKGIIDTVFKYINDDGQEIICMCDWKTSSNLNRFKTMCQLNLYALLFKEYFPNIKIDEIRTLSITKQGWRFSQFRLSPKIAKEILHLYELKRLYNNE